MKTENVMAALIIVVVLAVLTAIGLVIFRLDLDMLYTLALVLVVGVIVALIIAATAFPIRARKGGGPHERERIIRETKHTHTIDGRKAESPHIYTVNQQPSGFPGMFPELLRAAYLSGHRQDQLGPGEAREEVIEADITDLTDEWGNNEWSGSIRDTENAATQK
jgi:hypothetical protein